MGSSKGSRTRHEPARCESACRRERHNGSRPSRGQARHRCGECVETVAKHRIEALPFGCQQQQAWSPFEQLQTGLVFEQPDLMADRCGCDGELSGRALKAQVPRGSLKRTKAARGGRRRMRIMAELTSSQR